MPGAIARSAASGDRAITLKRSPIQPNQSTLLKVCNKIARRLTLGIGYLCQCRCSQQGDGSVGVGWWDWIGCLQNQTGAVELDGSSLMDVP